MKSATPRKLWSVLGNSQRLDGGAMFGNAPKAMWSKWMPPDDHNRILLATRSLLVQEDNGRLLMFEAGIGAFFPPKLKDRFGVQEQEDMLERNLNKLGFSMDDIEIVVLSHLHFDHAGGLLKAWKPQAAPSLNFAKAKFLTSKAAWERANNPHPRDRASFIADLLPLLEQSGRLELIEDPTPPLLGDGYRFEFSEGHTPGLALCEVQSETGPILYAGDLIPARAWMHAPITMGYDRYPELLINEKVCLLDRLADEKGKLFFTHDPEVAMAEVCRDEQNRFAPGRCWKELNAFAA